MPEGVRLLSDDPHDQSLLANVHPRGWINPEPTTQCNLLVIGAGTAGLVAAAVAAGLSARVGLVKERLQGGDPLNAKAVLARWFAWTR
jgi:NADPH-dependent 2,4-dienoyl-CoA reductase/sulfur reductase-like enzyme